MLLVMVHQVGSLDHACAAFRLLARVQVAVEAGEITAGDFHSQLVPCQEHIGS